MNLEEILTTPSLADTLSAEEAFDIANTVLTHYETDLESRVDWMNSYEKWMDMVGQRVETKSKPWMGAANVKFPLMTQAALSFNARALPALLPNSAPVGAGKVGIDEDGSKAQAARSVAQHMNYQVSTEMEEWEEEFDRLLMAVPVSGMEFKKTYYDQLKGRNVSKHITPLNLVINYYATDLQSSRKTEIHRMNKNQIIEKINSGVFVDVDWDTLEMPASGKELDAEANNMERIGLEEPSVPDSATPYTVLEYHGWWDLDEDGYEEPYIIVVLEQTSTLLAVYPRFGEESIMMGAEEQLIRIEPYESYTKYGFLPNPDGSFYDIGFGHLLYPINAVVNTTINQLIDAGTLANMQGGFLGRGVNVRGGNFAFGPGKWINVNAAGEDLRKGIVPMPIKEPSTVLFQLMSYMIEAGNKLSSTTDIFTGEHPGQNTKAGVTQAVRDEGGKVFNSIYKRLRRSLRSELDKLFELNWIVLNAGEAAANTKIQKSAQAFGVTSDHYANPLVIEPSADPNIAIKEQRLQKDMMVRNSIMENGIGNLVEAQRRLFIDLEVENVEAILPPDFEMPENPADALEAEKAQLEIGVTKVEIQEKIKGDALERQLKQMQAEIDNRKQALEEWKAQTEIQLEIERLKETRTASTEKVLIESQKLEKDFITQVEATRNANKNRLSGNSDSGGIPEMEGRQDN